MTANVNSGEMVLTRQMQVEFMAALRGGGLRNQDRGRSQIVFNVAPGATVDRNSVRDIERILLQAEREGRLETVKAKLR
jgi:hypothetical protein